MKTTNEAIEVRGLKKSYGELKVLDGISLSAKQGNVLGLLGPNGAGKTTTVRILSTLLRPDAGIALVNGYDVVKQPSKVKASIGLTGQYAAVDGYLTGKENLLLMGRLYRLSIKDTARRAEQLIEQFDLIDAANRQVKTYSGGMKRRIDLAMSLISSPPIIFLDEPTTGLDPRSRISMWDTIKKLAKSGTTILLTTQYMDEADRLADTIVVIDNGKVIAEGTSDILKAKVGADRLEITIGKQIDFKKVESTFSDVIEQLDHERRIVSIAGKKSGVGEFREILQRLEEARIEVEGISLHRPTLDDVFLSLTGKSTGKKAAETKTTKKGKTNG
jgi:ABC-2 type transport system ATP-binding protein